MKKNSFIFYETIYEMLRELPDEQFIKFSKAVYEYGLYENKPEFTGIEKALWIQIQFCIDNSKEYRTKQSDNRKGKTNADQTQQAKSKADEAQPTSISFNQTQPNETNINQTQPNVNVNGNVNENLNSYAASAPFEPETPSSSPKKTPLTDREPVNDLERVEKAYLDNYTSLYDKGILKIPKPCLNWGQCRKLERERITEYGLEKILSALDKAAQDNFCVQRGYSLSMILSAGTLNSLFNGNGWKHDQRAIDSVDRVTDAELSDVPF